MNFKLYIFSLMAFTSFLLCEDRTEETSKIEQDVHDFCDKNASKILPTLAAFLLLRRGRSRILKTVASSVLFFPAYAAYNKKGIFSLGVYEARNGHKDSRGFLGTYIDGWNAFKDDIKEASEEISILNIEKSIDTFKKYINPEK